METNTKGNTSYISFASAVSAIAVLYLHANGCFWKFDATAGYWPSANVIESVCYFAVPVFFMISGVTLLDYQKKYSLKEYFKRRVKKTWIPYVAWSFIGVALYIYVFHSLYPSTVTARYIVEGLLNGNLVSIYWFFIPLFTVYLSIPIIASIPQDKRISVYSYTVAVGIALNSVAPFIISIFKWNIKYNIQLSAATGYLLYVLLGYLIHNTELSRKQRTVIYILSIAGLLIHMIGTYKASMEAGEIVKTYKGYLNPPCYMYSVGVFLLMKDLGSIIMNAQNGIGGSIRKIVSKLNRYTLSLYLMQVFVLKAINSMTFIDTTGLAYRIITPWITLMLIMGIVFVIRKVPIVRAIVP